MTQPNEPDANFTYWAKMAHWTILEGASLLVGINPQIAGNEYELQRKIDRQASERFSGVHALARRTYAFSYGYRDNITPREWMAWAKLRDLPIPPQLEVEVERHHPPESSEPDPRDMKIAELGAKAVELSNELTALRTAAGQALGAKQRDSMLKLIIGMAIAGYRYDPKAGRSDSVKDITNDLARLGLSLTGDTVRKYLREGAALLPMPEDGKR